MNQWLPVYPRGKRIAADYNLLGISHMYSLSPAAPYNQPGVLVTSPLPDVEPNMEIGVEMGIDNHDNHEVALQTEQSKSIIYPQPAQENTLHMYSARTFSSFKPIGNLIHVYKPHWPLSGCSRILYSYSSCPCQWNWRSTSYGCPISYACTSCDSFN